MFKIEFIHTSNGHKDLELILGDAHYIVDSYYFKDFFKFNMEDHDVEFPFLRTHYSKYLNEEILSANKHPKFVVFDLSDQYIGGMLIHVDEEKNYHLNYVYTDRIHAYAINIDQLKDAITKNISELSSEGTWVFTRTEIEKGLATSLSSLKKAN